MVKLQDMRNPRHLRWPLYFLFAVVCVSFIFFYGWHPSESQRNPGIYGKLLSESSNPFKRWTYIRRPQMMDANRHLMEYNEMFLPQMARQVLQQRNMLDTVMSRLITTDEEVQDAANQILIDRAAREMGITATREEIIKGIKAQPGVNEQMLEYLAYQKRLGSKQELIEYFRRQNEAERVRNFKSMVAQASLFELWQEYSLANDKLKLEIAAFPNDDFTSKVLVTDQDVKSWYDSHRKDYRIPSQRRYLYIKTSREDVSKTVKPTTDQLLEFYKQNQKNYERSAAVKVRELQLMVRSGESIAQAMNLMDDLRTSAAKMTDWNPLADTLREKKKLPIYSRESDWLNSESSERPANYIATVTTLAGDAVSTPILSTLNMDNETTSVRIARVIARRPAGVPPFDEIRAQVQNDYVTQETDRQLKDVSDKWKLAKRNAKNMAELAKSLGVDDRITSMTDATSYIIPGAGVFQTDADYVASLSDGTISDPVASTDGSIVMLQPTDTVPERDPDIKDVRAKIVAAIQNDRSGGLARKAAEDALKLVQSGAQFKQALADAPIKPTVTDPQTRTQQVKVLRAPLIDFTRLTLRAAKGSVGMSPFGNDKDQPLGYAVWMVVDYQPAGMKQFAADRQRFERDYLEIQRLALVNEWLRDERAKAGFEIIKQQE
ncbi:hypothetical protein LLG95_12590 [bacterium]|nr:hypothetical protein [bacterium]